MIQSPFTMLHDPAEVTVAIFCVTAQEVDPVIYAFDERIYPSFNIDSRKDTNLYCAFGRISTTTVVVVQLGFAGSADSKTRMDSLRNTFTNIDLTIACGMCGGSPHATPDDPREMYLGDVVIGSGMVFVDPSAALFPRNQRKVVSSPHVHALLARLTSPTGLSSIAATLPALRNTLLDAAAAAYAPIYMPTKDVLYDDIVTPHRHGVACYTALGTCPPGDHEHRNTCSECSATKVCESARWTSCSSMSCRIVRLRPSARSMESTELFHGVVGCATRETLRNGKMRDALANRYGARAFEMEGLGLWSAGEEMPCLVIKGVSDYADSHKQKEWQAYAATNAAAVTKLAIIAHERLV